MVSRGPASTEFLSRSSAPAKLKPECLTRACSEEFLVVVVHSEDFVERVLVRVDMHHPAEDDGLETSIRSLAGFFCGDRSPQSKLRPVRVPELSLLRHAKVGVQMPGGTAERDAGVGMLS